MVSSASFIGSEWASAFEWASTERIPSSRHVRMTRSAISPRFAIRILWNMSAAEDPPPLGFELGQPQAVDARHRLGHRLAGAQPGQELAQGLHPAAVEEIADDPERDVVARPCANRIGVGGQRLHAGEREPGGSAQNLVGGGALERLRQPLVEPARRPAARQIVDGGVGVLVAGQTLQLLGPPPEPAHPEAKLSLEKPRWPPREPPPR